MFSVNRVPLLICTGSFLLLSGCRPAATPAPTDTPAKQLTFTLTTNPSKIHTSTEALTATDTRTITPTYTSTPAYNVPGKYPINRCAVLNPAPDITDISISVTFCVSTVEVNADFTMKFNVLWDYRCTNQWHNTGGCPSFLKPASDLGEKYMYLTDNLENNYYYSDVGGAAGYEDQIDPNTTIYGWFLFPPAKAGAKSFRIIDLGNRVAVDEIVLIYKDGVYAPTSTPTTIEGTPFNAPGTYYIYKCVTYPPTGRLIGADKVRLCLTSVVVNPDGTMKFNLTWTISTSILVVKDSDANNNNIFLLDNLDHEYRHTQTGGCPADIRAFARDGESCAGWFLFPAAQPGATSFRYVDLGNLISFDDIVLLSNN
jgi:hypothetical protein